MIKGENGFSLYTDVDTGKINYIVYSQIPYANYSIGLVVPQEQIMAEVNNLQSLFIYIFLVAASITVLIFSRSGRSFLMGSIFLN